MPATTATRANAFASPVTEGAPEVNAWLTIDTAGTVTIRVPHTEQGQGALTSVASMISQSSA